MRRLIGLYGYGGFGREVMPLLLAQIKRADEDADVVFVADQLRSQPVNGVTVMSHHAFLRHPAPLKAFNIAIADAAVRARIAGSLAEAEIAPLAIRAASADIFDGSEIGDGAIFCGFATVTANARIGRFFHANIYAYVAHDCVIGDFVTFAPRVNCNGNVVIGDHAYVGTAAVIRQGTADRPLRIGEGAVIGMGAVVTKDVPPHTTVVGNPARPMGAHTAP